MNREEMIEKMARAMTSTLVPHWEGTAQYFRRVWCKKAAAALDAIAVDLPCNPPLEPEEQHRDRESGSTAPPELAGSWQIGDRVVYVGVVRDFDKVAGMVGTVVGWTFPDKLIVKYPTSDGNGHLYFARYSDFIHRDEPGTVDPEPGTPDLDQKRDAAILLLEAAERYVAAKPASDQTEERIAGLRNALIDAAIGYRNSTLKEHGDLSLHVVRDTPKPDLTLLQLWHRASARERLDLRMQVWAKETPIVEDYGTIGLSIWLAMTPTQRADLLTHAARDRSARRFLYTDAYQIDIMRGYLGLNPETSTDNVRRAVIAQLGLHDRPITSAGVAFAGWRCECSESPDHPTTFNPTTFNFCPICGASRVGPIQATEEELAGFLSSMPTKIEIEQPAEFTTLDAWKSLSPEAGSDLLDAALRAAREVKGTDAVTWGEVDRAAKVLLRKIADEKKCGGSDWICR